MLKIFFGEEDFLVSRAINDIKKEFIEKNQQASIQIFSGGEKVVEDFLSSLSQGGGLFSPKKLVIAEDIFDYVIADQRKILEFLKKQFRSIENVDLVISWRGKPKASELLNYLKRKKEKIEFKKLTSSELEKFIVGKLKDANEIEVGALKFLATNFRQSLWLLDKELEKLINLKSGEIITIKDVEKISNSNVDAKIFDLVDAIGGRNKRQAFELLDSLLEQGEDGFYILSMMIFQIRNLALVLDCKNKGIFNHQEISQKTGLHPYVAQKTFGQLGRFDDLKIKQMYKRAFLLDINSKSGKINIKEALADFIIKI